MMRLPKSKAVFGLCAFLVMVGAVTVLDIAISPSTAKLIVHSSVVSKIRIERRGPFTSELTTRASQPAICMYGDFYLVHDDGREWKLPVSNDRTDFWELWELAEQKKKPVFEYASDMLEDEKGSRVSRRLKLKMPKEVAMQQP